MAFRRSFNKVEQGQITRKAITMTMAIIVVLLLSKFVWDRYQQPVVNEIVVEMLDKNQFVVQQDTTNYEQFASVLKKTVISARKTYPANKIILKLPKQIDKSGEISNIIMVVTAMDLEWEIKN